MVDVTAKIGEFFASLIFAILGAGFKLLAGGVILLALLVAALFAIAWLIRRPRSKRRR